MPRNRGQLCYGLSIPPPCLQRRSHRSVGSLSIPESMPYHTPATTHVSPPSRSLDAPPQFLPTLLLHRYPPGCSHYISFTHHRVIYATFPAQRSSPTRVCAPPSMALGTRTFSVAISELSFIPPRIPSFEPSHHSNLRPVLASRTTFGTSWRIATTGLRSTPAFQHLRQRGSLIVLSIVSLIFGRRTAKFLNRITLLRRPLLFRHS